MSAELHALRGSTPRKNPIALVAVAGLGSLVLGVGVALVLLRSPAPPPALPASPPPPETVTPPAVPQPPIPLEPLDPNAPSAKGLAAPPSGARSTTARWIARVTRAEGLPLVPGTACTVDATISTTDTNTHVQDLSVQCGSQSLYRSTDRLNGMAQMSSDAREILGPTDDKSTFTLAYRDLGTRTGERAQVDLDSTHRQATVFRETIPRSRVELSLPVASAPGAPLSGPEQRLRRTGKISSVTGLPPVKEGATCVLRAMPNGKQKDCVAEIVCGTTILFPPSLPLKCQYEASRPSGIATAEGVTRLSLVGSRASVKAAAFGADLELDDP